MNLKQDKCGQNILENDLGASPKATIEQEQKVKIVYLYWPINKSKKSQLIK